jgi:eukaryotic-like serine/threonine-protein kinase
MTEERTPQWSPLEEHVRESVRAKLFEQPRDPVKVGRFELLQKLGQGGMGVVFAARDPELDRTVAIKMLHSDGSDDVQRLLREAKAMARLSHPNVVTVFEAGTAREQVFLAMEFVQGRDLRRWIAAGPHSWRDVLALLVQAARGLVALHGAGLVHRDFKPENVMITDDGIAKVADFGLARATTDTAAVEETLERSDADADIGVGIRTITRAGAIVGTPAYAAPEVLEGRRGDARSDQFSFCVTAHEALYGERPFHGNSLHSLVENMTRGRVRPVPENTRVPGRVRRLLARGMSADPHARHASMSDLADAFDALLARRRRATTMVAAAGVLGIGVAVTWPRHVEECSGSAAAWSAAWDDGRRTAVQDAMHGSGHPDAVATFERVATVLDAYGEEWMSKHREACGANARGEESDDVLDGRMACLSGRRDRADALVDALVHADATAVDRAIEAAKQLPEIEVCDDPFALAREEPLPADPDLRATILDLYARRQQALVLDSLGQHVEARASLEAIRDEADAVGHRPLQALVRTDLVQANIGTPEKRDTLYDALFFAESAGYDTATRVAWTKLIEIHARLTEYDAAARAARHAEAIVERLGNRPEHVAAIGEAKGFMYLEKGELAAAVTAFTAAVEIVEALDPDAPIVGQYLANLGTAYTLKGDDALALPIYERAYDHSVRTVGQMHRTVGHNLFNLGRVTAHVDRIDESNEYYERALEIFRAVAPPGDLSMILALNNLGQNYGDQGHYPEAIAMIQEAIALLEADVGPENRKLVRMRRGLAEIYLYAGDLPRAIDEAEHALRVSIASFGDDHPETSATRRRLARILVAAKRPEDAVPLLERAMADEATKDVPPHQAANTMFWLAAALQYDPKTLPRARELAEGSIPGMSQGESKDRHRVEEVRAWLERGGTLGREDHP